MVQSTLIALAVGVGIALAIARGVSPDGSMSSPAPPNAVLYPVFVMFFLVAAVLTRMGFLRVGSVLEGTMDVRFYRTYDEGEEPEHMKVVTRHFINLFEMPVLLYVGVIVAHLANEVTCLLVGLAWGFVLLRLFHTYVHLTSNDVTIRLSGYAASGLLLLGFWTTLLVQMFS